MKNIYLIRRMLRSIGDAVGTEPLISLASEKLQELDIDGELWVQYDDQNANFFHGHPLVSKILISNQQPPADARLVLDISTADECPSMKSLCAGGKVNATALFCEAASVDGHPLVYDWRPPQLYYTTEEIERIRFIRRGFAKKKIVLQVQGGKWWKMYPYLKKVIAELIKSDYYVFVTSNEPIPFSIEGIVPLVALSHRELMVWLEVMDLMIGFDSGPTHIAAAVGTRTYGIYGPTDPQEILGPYGPHVSWNTLDFKCTRKHCWMKPCAKLYCLRSLSPWDILEDIEGAIQENYKNPQVDEGPNTSYGFSPPLLVSNGEHMLRKQRVDQSTAIVARNILQSREHSPVDSRKSTGPSIPVVAPKVSKPKKVKKGSYVSPTRLSIMDSISNLPHPLVGVLTLGGVGDDILRLNVLKKYLRNLKMQIGDFHTCYIVRDHAVLFEQQPFIDTTVSIGARTSHFATAEYLRSACDILVDVRYVGKVITNFQYSAYGSKVSWEDTWGGVFHRHPNGARALERFGRHYMHILGESLGIECPEYDLPLVDAPVEGLPEKFVVISNGTDGTLDAFQQTKSFPIATLEILCAELQILNLPVVEIGSDISQKLSIPGTIDLVGKTTLPQLFFVLRKATSILCNEGGIAHIAAALNKRAVVGFGPTWSPFWRYECHTNLWAGVCEPCWFTHCDWYFNCLKGTGLGSRCMAALTIEELVNGICNTR